MPCVYDFHMRFQITGLRAWVFAFLASKGFLTCVGKHVIFQSAWPPAREAALIAGKGLLSRMLQHVFLDIISLDAWIAALVTTETPFLWMCWQVLFWSDPSVCLKEEVQWMQWKGFFPWMSENVPFEKMWRNIRTVGNYKAFLQSGFTCGF